jgi:uncharacterized protein GlcG (DUF336 family)
MLAGSQHVFARRVGFLTSRAHPSRVAPDAKWTERAAQWHEISTREQGSRVKNSVEKRSVTLAGAQVVVNAALAEAEERDVSVVIAVVDDGGNVVLLARMDGAAYQNPSVATDKAYTAAGYKRTTKEFYDFVKDDPQLTLGVPLAVPRMAIFGGGVPLAIDEVVIGAVGVSGSGWQTDEAIAIAGAGALTNE